MDLIHYTCCYRSECPSSSSVTQPLVLCFGSGPVSACRLPSGVCSLPRQEGSLIWAGETEGYDYQMGMYQGVPAEAESCRMLLQSEAGHPLSQRYWLWVVGQTTHEEPSCIGSWKGVGSNMCLLMAWWQLLPVGQDHRGSLSFATSGTLPGFGSGLSACISLSGNGNCNCVYLHFWHSCYFGAGFEQECLLLVLAVHSHCSSHLWHSQRQLLAICECRELEGPQSNHLLPLWEAHAFPWTSSAVSY